MMENDDYYNNRKTNRHMLCGCFESASTPNHDQDSSSETTDGLLDLHRVISLTATEKYALGSLFLDASEDQSKPPRDMLTGEILFSTPYPKVSELQHNNLTSRDQLEVYQSLKPGGIPVRKQEKKKRRNSKHHKGLWKAHEIGVTHNLFQMKGPFSKRESAKMKHSIEKNDEIPKPDLPSETYANAKQSANNLSKTPSNALESDAAKTSKSQCENRAEGRSIGSSSSWDDEPGHYDAWQVLGDEYAKDFGFDYKPEKKESFLNDDSTRCFKILGTSSDDMKAQPHVLSPPLMDSLLNFVPESLSSDNWWLKYSLVRDGASLDTFRNYCRAAPYTVIAIQTLKGDVFGSFTTQPWHTGEHDYFGNGESFVWKMRNNRFEHCCSLFEQAQMESECDIYPSSGLNTCFQYCTQDMLGVGGGEIDHGLSFDNNAAAEVFGKVKSLGFAIVLHDDLLRGTTSQSATFCNKILTCDNDGVFDVSNLEVWTFTPCTSVDTAEKLEMKKHFIHESMRKQSTSVSSVGSSEVPSSPMSSQRMFFRRIGESDDNQHRREQWATVSTKFGESSLSTKTPRFMS